MQDLPWTQKDIMRLIDYWNTDNLNSVKIGRMLDRSPGSIISKVRRLRDTGTRMCFKSKWGIRENKSKEPVTKRTCLKCQKNFLSEGPFNRICRKCHATNIMVHEASIMSLGKSIGGLTHT